MAILTVTSKDNLFEAVEWVGFMAYADYPYWLQRLIDRGVVYSTPSADYFVDNGKDYEVDVGDMFIINRQGAVRYFSQGKFLERWIVVEETAQQHSCVVSYVGKLFDAVEWQGMEKLLTYPYWFQTLIDQGYVYDAVNSRLLREAIHYSSAEGELAVSIGDVFIINPWGEVRLYNVADFHTHWVVVSEAEVDEDYYTV